MDIDRSPRALLSRGAVACLLLAVGCGYALSIAADGRKFKGVWYRTEERGKFAVFLASGDLTIGPDVLSFESKKRTFTIATSSVRRVRWLEFEDDPYAKWVAVDYSDQGAVRLAAFRDAHFGRDSEAILASIQSVAPPASPETAVASHAPEFVMPGEPGTPSTYVEHSKQFTIDVPSGWFVRDQSNVAGPAAIRGVIAFAAESFSASGGSAEEARHAVMRHDTGESPTFFVDLHPSGSGMSCDGYTKSAETTVVTAFQSEGSLGKGTAVSQPARVEVVRIGGCFGLKVLIHARESDGHQLTMLVDTVSDGTTRYDFTLRALDEFFERNLPAFERSVGSVKLTSARAAQAGH